MMSEIKDIQFAIHNVFENITDNAISNDIIERVFWLMMGKVLCGKQCLRGKLTETCVMHLS